LNIYYLQGGAATDSKGGGNFNPVFFQRSFLNLTSHSPGGASCYAVVTTTIRPRFGCRSTVIRHL